MWLLLGVVVVSGMVVVSVIEVVPGRLAGVCGGDRVKGMVWRLDLRKVLKW